MTTLATIKTAHNGPARSEAQANEIIAGLSINQVGQIFAQSGYFQDARDAAQCMVKVLAGREFGVGPFQAMTSIHLIKGKPALHYAFIAGKIKASGKYNYRVKRLDQAGCWLEFLENGQPIGEYAFTVEDAVKAGLAGGDNYRKYARSMFMARAISAGYKVYCPDIFMSPVYTPEDFGGVIDDRGQLQGVDEKPKTPPAAPRASALLEDDAAPTPIDTTPEKEPEPTDGQGATDGPAPSPAVADPPCGYGDADDFFGELRKALMARGFTISQAAEVMDRAAAKSGASDRASTTIEARKRFWHAVNAGQWDGAKGGTDAVRNAQGG